MHDEEIRKILIKYLQATYPDMRIYQEKNIGTSVCDVMAVTNELIGFEIKSNSDNLSRLPGQIKSYDSFFDKNYIVVGDKYGRYIHTKVPAHWGIVEIGETHIHIVRWAGMNKEASCRKQLEILWKLELKNILIKNSLPLYAQRDKAYIRDRILEHIPTKKLKKQIVTELLHRDYNVFTNTNNFHSYDPKENDVAAEIVDSLSEMNLSKFTLDEWISLYQQADEVRNEKEENFRKPIIERPPHAIIYKDIEVTLGAPWIDKHIVNEFIHELLETGSDKNIVEYEEVTGSWHIRDKNWFVTGNPNAELKYGLKKYNALWILEATLNLREIKLFDNGKVDESSTIAAIEKQKLIIEAFKEWVWKDEDRRWEIEEAYNKIFEPYDIKNYDGRNLEFQDMNPKYELFPYQKDAVEKIRMTPNTLLSFDVGAGKTYIMIAAAMMMRQEGFARKNMFVVPNHIVGQWEKIFTDLYPSAKVLAIEPKDFRPELRQKVLKQMQEGDYDGIIIAYSCFELIPLSTDSILDNMNQQVQRIDQAIQILRQRQGRIPFSQTYGESPLKREREYIESLTKDFLRSMRERSYNSITFDELGINTLFLDEAHNYKNIPIRTKLKNLNGINTKGSKKCLDMMHKVRCVQAQNNGRGVVFATGTPLCNSISDAYAMQMYLQHDDLEKHHLDVFDNWVKTFAKPEQLFEIDVNGTNYRMVRRFVKFHNLPELSRIFSQIAIFYAMGKQPELPECQEQIDVVIPKYKELSDYMVTLCKRSEEIRSKKINPKYDNMLKVSTDGRKAALSLELVGAIQPYHECSKVFFCVKNIVQMYEADANSTQVVFCDYSTPKGDQYSVYKELKERLIEAGIPDNEIAIIHHYTTESKKVALYQKFNDGEKRILIGSTFKLGTGANIQTKLKAIHHLDVPWRPADMVQREGRMIRRGNLHDEVYIFRYVTQGSFDSYSWQILETKQNFITQFLSGSSYQREISDLEQNVLSYAEVKALALAEPLMKKLAEKENELKTLHIVASKAKEERKKLREEMETLETTIPKYMERHRVTKEHEQYLNGKTNQEFTNMYEYLKNVLTTDILYKNAQVETDILGFNLILPEEQDEKKPYIQLERGNEKYDIMMGNSNYGNARRIINFFKKFPKETEKAYEAYCKAVTRKAEIEEILRRDDYDSSVEFEKCRKEIENLREQIKERIGV